MKPKRKAASAPCRCCLNLPTASTLPHRASSCSALKTGRCCIPETSPVTTTLSFASSARPEPSVRHLSPHCCRHTFATLTREVSDRPPGGAGAFGAYGHKNNGAVFPRRHEQYGDSRAELARCHFVTKSPVASLTLLLDVHGVTGSSPVPRTTEKVLKPQGVSRLFLLLFLRFSLFFPLIVSSSRYGLNKLFHPLCAVSLHLLRDVSVNIQRKRSGSVSGGFPARS